MRTTRAAFVRRRWVVGITGGLVVIFATAALAPGGVSFAQVILAVSAMLFVYIVVRLTQSMYAADADRRRHARRGLMFASVVPALILTPTAVGSSAAELTVLLVVAAVVWAALALAYTSYVLASVTTSPAPRAAPVHRARARALHLGHRPRPLA